MYVGINESVLAIRDHFVVAGRGDNIQKRMPSWKILIGTCPPCHLINKSFCQKCLSKVLTMTSSFTLLSTSTVLHRQAYDVSVSNGINYLVTLVIHIKKIYVACLLELNGNVA